jgi:hypothetical protein
MLGGLIDPRREEETLAEYKGRLSTVAEEVLNRDLSPEEGSWRADREKELEGRLGTSVSLISGEDDDQLRDQAEGNLITYDNIGDRTGSFRWPELQPQGEQPRYGYGKTSGGGVATSAVLEPISEGRLKGEPGYVVAEGAVHYVPADLNTTNFYLPPGTDKTVLPPWHIQSSQAHRIEVVSANSLRLVGEDGHEHVVRRGGTQESYDPAGSGRPEHTHAVKQIDASGPAFAQTRPHNPTTAEARKTGNATVDAKAFVSIGPGRTFPVPSLHAQVVQTDSDDTGHVHEVKVSPHDYWSGTFPLPGEDHNHRVEDWSVTAADGHTHTITQPTVPNSRALVPRLVAYEGERLKPSTDSPYALNMEMQQGWIVASCPGGFSQQIVLGFETGGKAHIPSPESRDGIVGLGPKVGADHFFLSTIRARVGSDLRVAARLEDTYTGGVPNEKVTARWNLSASTPPSIDFYTDKDGVADVRIPTDANQTSYTVEFSAAGVTRTQTFELESFGEVGGYGIDYGLDYGS